MTPAAAGATGRIPELDGIRGLAILLVMILHAFFAVPERSPFFDWLGRVGDYAYSGVDLFFVLSGFLIGGIILDAQNKDRWAVTFYARRFFRIFPLYYCWLLLTLLVSWALGRFGAPQPWRELFHWEIPDWMFPAYLQNLWMAYH